VCFGERRLYCNSVELEMPASTPKRDSHGQKQLQRVGHLALLAAFLLSSGAMLLPPLTVAQSQEGSAPLRDPDAIAIIQSSLNAMGGTEAWVLLRAATTTGSLTAPNSASASPFTWTDDWTAGIRMRRDNTAKDGSHKLFVQGSAADLPSAPPSANDAVTAKFHPPHFDKVTALIFHLPGAALSVVLQDSKYSISTTSPPNPRRSFQGKPDRADRSTPDLSDTSCVLIVRTPQGSGDSAANLTLCFSNKSKLPVYAKVMQPNIIDPTKPLPETVEYSGFRRMGPVFVPSAVSIIDPLKRQKVLTVNSVSWNANLPSNPSSGVTQ
jgi:hypothetical protein